MIFLAISLVCLSTVWGFPQAPAYSDSYAKVRVQKPNEQQLQSQSYLIDPKVNKNEKTLLPAGEEPFENFSTEADATTTTESIEGQEMTTLMGHDAVLRNMNGTSMDSGFSVQTTHTMMTSPETMTQSEERKNLTKPILGLVSKKEEYEPGSGDGDAMNEEEERMVKKVLDFESKKTDSHEEFLETTEATTTTEVYVEILYPDNINDSKKSVPSEEQEKLMNLLEATSTTEMDNATTTTSPVYEEATTTEDTKELTTRPSCGTKDPPNEPRDAYPQNRNGIDEVGKRMQPNYELAEEVDVENVNVNSVNGVNPQFVDLIYYVYNPNGYYQRVSTFDTEDSETLSQSSQYRFDNVEPIKELPYTFNPNFLVFQRLKTDK